MDWRNWMLSNFDELQFSFWIWSGALFVWFAGRFSTV
jgi:hypothetical protein